MNQVLRDLLEAHFQPTLLIINNESHLHAGHTAMKGITSNESHFAITIQSDILKNLSRLAAQREVMNVITPLFSKGLHACRLQIVKD
jgi:BolA-like protein 1